MEYDSLRINQLDSWLLLLPSSSQWRHAKGIISLWREMHLMEFTLSSRDKLPMSRDVRMLILFSLLIDLALISEILSFQWSMKKQSRHDSLLSRLEQILICYSFRNKISMTLTITFVLNFWVYLNAHSHIWISLRIWIGEVKCGLKRDTALHREISLNS